jgi:hypothetical protein
MVFHPTAQMDIVKREQKENKLAAFIDRHLEEVRRHGLPIAVVARSTQSPVVRAVQRVLAEGGVRSAGIRVQLLIALSDLEGLDQGPSSGIEVRRLKDGRLLNAHEQMVLGPRTAWIGDCMRRDPAGRDAYECHADDCGITAAWTATSFGHLWDGAELSTERPQGGSAAGVAITSPHVASAALEPAHRTGARNQTRR